MKNFLSVIGAIVVGFVILLIVVSVSSTLNMQNNGLTPPSRSTPRQQTATDIATRMDSSMEKSMPGAFRSEYDELNSIYKVDMWDNYTAQDIETLQNGLGLDRWESSCDQVVSLCDDMQQIFDNNGHPEVTVVLSLVDTEDHDYVFATAARGVIGYDVVRGIDLKNKSEA